MLEFFTKTDHMRDIVKLPCEFPGCEKSEQIRSKVKDRDSEHFGLYVCKYHANLLRKKTRSDKTRRTQEARKEQRKDYPEFFQKMCEIARVSVCEECGIRLRGNSTEIAHILSKAEYMSPEVATDPTNILFLCSDHHTQFDRNLETRSQMKANLEAKERYKLLQERLTNVTAETLFYDKS